MLCLLLVPRRALPRSLAAGFAIELRRDRRRQLAAARQVLAEFKRAELEIFVVVTDFQALQAQSETPAEISEEELAAGWAAGPHLKISGDAWLTHAAEFVGALNEEDFNVVDGAAAGLQSAGEFGLTIDYDANQLRAAMSHAERILEPRRSW